MISASGAAALVLADHVTGDALLGGVPLAEEGEEDREGPLPSDCILRAMKRRSSDGRFAERVLSGVDDSGGAERIVIWIERKPGALWAVGRAVNPQHRSSDEPRADDWVFEGYELDDALEKANETLEDDLSVLERDGADLRGPCGRSRARKSCRSSSAGSSGDKALLLRTSA